MLYAFAVLICRKLCRHNRRISSRISLELLVVPWEFSNYCNSVRQNLRWSMVSLNVALTAFKTWDWCFPVHNHSHACNTCVFMHAIRVQYRNETTAALQFKACRSSDDYFSSYDPHSLLALWAVHVQPCVGERFCDGAKELGMWKEKEGGKNWNRVIHHHLCHSITVFCRIYSYIFWWYKRAWHMKRERGWQKLEQSCSSFPLSLIQSLYLAKTMMTLQYNWEETQTAAMSDHGRSRSQHPSSGYTMVWRVSVDFFVLE